MANASIISGWKDECCSIRHCKFHCISGCYRDLESDIVPKGVQSAKALSKPSSKNTTHSDDVNVTPLMKLRE